MATPPGVRFIIDSNELASNHFAYPFEPFEKKNLEWGDYSIIEPGGQSLEHEVVVERKSLVNILGDSVGEHRERWQRCLEGLAQLRYPAIVVEASWSDVLKGGYEYTRLDARAATGSLIAWSQRYRIPIWLAGDREQGMELTRRLLVRAVLDRASKPSPDPAPAAADPR